MDSDQPTPPALRRLPGPFAVLLALLLMLLLLVGWLFGTTSGARTAFSAIASLSGGTLTAQGIEGQLGSSLRLQRLTLKRQNDSLVFSGLRLNWQPSALLRAKLHIVALHVEQLVVIGKIDTTPEPAKLPDTIALPLTLQADDVRVAAGEIRRGPVKLIGFGPIAMQVVFDGDQYALRLHEFAAGAALQDGAVTTRFSGSATLAATKPYALQGRFSSDSTAQAQGQTVGAAGQLTLGGSLADIAATIDFTVNQAALKGHAMLRPFSDQLLGTTQLHVQTLNLSTIDPTLPHTVLDIRLSASDSGNGELQLSNTAAGPYSDGKLPVSILSLSFRQAAGQFHFDRLDARLGAAKQPAGDITGKGRYADGALTLGLHTEALDAQRIDRRMRPTRLSGNLDIRHANGRQEFALALSEPLRRQHLLLEIRGVVADSNIALEHAELQAGDSRIVASGHVALAGTQGFSAKGEVERFRVQDLGDFAQLPTLLLNGSFSLEGTRAPQLEADLSFDIRNSHLDNQPLSGRGRAQLRRERLLVQDFHLLAGANRLQAEGMLAQENSQLSFDLNAPQLAQLGPAFGGALRASGTARGTLMQPRIQAQWSASNARMPAGLEMDSMQGKADIALNRTHRLLIGNAVAEVSARGVRSGASKLTAMSAQLRFSPQPNAPLQVDIKAEGIAAGQLRAEHLSLAVNGTTARHGIDALLRETGQDWSLAARGGLEQLTNTPRWRGEVTALNADGRFHAQLASPAALLLSAQRIQLDRFLLNTDAAHIAVEQFTRSADGIVTRGRIERLQLAELLRHLSPAPPVKTDLRLSGDWDVRMLDTLDGRFRLRRDSGDATVLGGSPVTLGLRNLYADIDINRGKLALQLQADGRQMGLIEANVATVIGGGSSRFSLAPNAPVSGRVRVDIPSMGWLGPLVSPSMIADGRLQSAVSLGGSIDQPQFSGRIEGSALRLTLSELGLDLRQGTLESVLEGDQLLIRHLQFRSGDGRLLLSGPIDLGSTVNAQLALQADRFALLNRSDRRLVVSGNSQIAWQENRAAVTGAFIVNSGFIDLGSADRPQLSSDIVVVGREKKKAGGMAAAVDVTVGLGDGVALRGRGLDAMLVGQVRLSNAAGEPLQARGTLSIAKGSYTAYGRELAIEQGFLRFTGAIDNPALDILAMRRGQEVEAGVSVRGTVLAPRVTLVSEPAVPEAEKLSWLVLGRGLEGAGEGDIGALQQAAGALLSEGAAAGVQSRIASAFGLDTLSVGTSQDSLQQRIFTLGKQVSSKLYVGYQQGLETAGSILQLRYLLSPHLSVEAEAGARSAISLFYNIAFD